MLVSCSLFQALAGAALLFPHVGCVDVPNIDVPKNIPNPSNIPNPQNNITSNLIACTSNLIACTSNLIACYQSFNQHTDLSIAPKQRFCELSMTFNLLLTDVKKSYWFSWTCRLRLTPLTMTHFFTSVNSRLNVIDNSQNRCFGAMERSVC